MNNVYDSDLEFLTVPCLVSNVMTTRHIPLLADNVPGPSVIYIVLS
jgi:hypothetical protein